MRTVVNDFVLANGDIIQVGMNMRALQLMAKFPGGLKSLQKRMSALQDLTEDEQGGEEAGEAMDAFAYLLWALIRAGGQTCTQEEAAMAIGLEDFEPLTQVFQDFYKAAERMSPKNSPGRATR